MIMEIPKGEEEVEETIGQPQEEETIKLKEFTTLEEELKEKLIAKTDPIVRENMEWELQLIHSANMCFF